MDKIGKKIGELFGSLRFWIVTLALVSSILEAIVSGTLTTTFVFDTFELWLGAVVAIGTLDSVAVKFGTSMKKK